MYRSWKKYSVLTFLDSTGENGANILKCVSISSFEYY